MQFVLLALLGLTEFCVLGAIRSLLVLLALLQVMPCDERVTGLRRQARDWNIWRITESPMKTSLLPARH
jgi:hypothetical protein